MMLIMKKQPRNIFSADIVFLENISRFEICLGPRS